jgi:hypothetical protein
MASREASALLGILERHGLSVDLLEAFVHHCETRQHGRVTFYTVDGAITSYELGVTGKVAARSRAQAKELAS